MVAEPITRRLSIEDAIIQVYEAALAGEAVAATAERVVHDIDDRDIHRVAARGLSTMVHERLARQRRGADPRTEEAGAEHATASGLDDGSAPPRPLKPREHAAKELWLDADYEGADKQRKALRAFTTADALHLRGFAGTKADGYARVRDAMDLAVDALQRTGKATIGELPRRERAHIGEVLA